MDVVSYKCPNCSAPLAFDIPTQHWKCGFCLSDFSAAEAARFEKQTDSETKQWAPEAFSQEEAAAYICPSCGGTVLADTHTAATFCAFCHSPAVLAGRLKGEYRPARLIPFKLVRDEALASMQKLLKRKFLLPRAFRSAVEKGEITGLYVPFWLFSADVDVSYSANGKRITMWSDSRYRYTKTDTYRVQRELELPLRRVPVDASKRMDDRLMDALEPFDYAGLLPFSMEYLSGCFAEGYDVDSQAAAPRFRQRADEGARSAVSDTTHGYNALEGESLRTALRGMDCTYVMLPVWTLTVRFQKKTYAFAMNGQTGKAAGRLPVSWGRAVSLFSALTALLTFIFFAGRLMG